MTLHLIIIIIISYQSAQSHAVEEGKKKEGERGKERTCLDAETGPVTSTYRQWEGKGRIREVTGEFMS